MLLQAAQQGQGTMAEAIMLRQPASTMKAVMDMHTAVGDLHRATQLDASLRQQYALVRDRLPALKRSASSKAMPTAATDLDPELRRVANTVTRGQIAPGTGSPVRTRIVLNKPVTTVTPIERNDNGR